MPSYTSNYNLTLPSFSESANIQVLNDNFSNIDTTMKSISDANLVQTADGTATNIILTLPSTLTNGYPITFVASASNGGSATNINSTYPLYKPATTTAPNLIKDKPYSIYYNSTGNCFFLRASSEGDALASHVLAGKKFSNDYDTGILGALDLSLLISTNIKSGITINGITGDSNIVNTSDALAVASQLLSGVTAYVKGIKVIGNMPNITLDQNASSYAVSGTTIGLKVPKGYWDGTHSVNVASTSLDSDLISANIVSGKNILGINGSATIESLGGKKYTSGTAIPVPSASSDSTAVISISVPFTPSWVYVYGTVYRMTNYSFIQTAKAIYCSADPNNLVYYIDSYSGDLRNGKAFNVNEIPVFYASSGSIATDRYGSVTWYAVE